MASKIIKKELFPGIPIEDVISHQDCIDNMSAICNIRQTGQDIFFRAKKIFNTSSYPCDTQWEISENSIGEESSNGLVYEGNCDGESKEYALKYINLKNLSTQDLKNIAKEINIQQLVYKKSGFTTPIYQIFINDEYLMFVTDKLNTTVYRYLMRMIKRDTSLQTIETLKKILKTCYDISIELMKTHNIFHGDEHLNNFMLTDDFNEENFDPSAIKIIDFGKTNVYNSIDQRAKMILFKQRLDAINSLIDFNLNNFRYNKPLLLKSVSDLMPNINEYLIQKI